MRYGWHRHVLLRLVTTDDRDLLVRETVLTLATLWYIQTDDSYLSFFRTDDIQIPSVNISRVTSKMSQHEFKQTEAPTHQTTLSKHFHTQNADILWTGDAAFSLQFSGANSSDCN